MSPCLEQVKNLLEKEALELVFDRFMHIAVGITPALRDSGH